MDVDNRIRLRGVRVHNLKDIDLDLPRGRLIVICGLSGSGKSSLAMDTLYAEGQRRYLESFSTYARQHLQQLERPEAESISGLPPAIAVTGTKASRSNRATVGTATETLDYLRLLFAKVGTIVCPGCGRTIRRDTPQSVAQLLSTFPAGLRAMIGFRVAFAGTDDWTTKQAKWLEAGFIRGLVGQHMRSFPVSPEDPSLPNSGDCIVVVDRIKTGSSDATRLRDSLETAFRFGEGRTVLLIEAAESASSACTWEPRRIDDRDWFFREFSESLDCPSCDKSFLAPEPRLFNFNSPWGACPRCEGFGNVIDTDMDLIVPDPRKTIREGAIAPWNSRSYRKELDFLLKNAKKLKIRVDVPFADLSQEEIDRLRYGVPEAKFAGIEGFFASLDKRKYRMHIRVFLSRWRSYRECDACGGLRLRPEALAVRVGNLNLSEVCRLSIDETLSYVKDLDLSAWDREVAAVMLEQVEARLDYLQRVGLGYLTLDRSLRTLSGGELRRVALASALGSSLVNVLYVLDEPSVGLHPADIDRLLEAGPW
ncbi:MAG: excinuclease ABC subunit A, partial [Planctomycetota bacterium]